MNVRGSRANQTSLELSDHSSASPMPSPSAAGSAVLGHMSPHNFAAFAVGNRRSHYSRPQANNVVFSAYAQHFHAASGRAGAKRIEMICHACGAAAPDDAKFCNACGASLSAQPDDTPNAVTTESPVVGDPIDDEQTGELRVPVDSATDELDELALTRLHDSIQTEELKQTIQITTTDEPAFASQVVWADDERPFDDTIDDMPASGIPIDTAAATQVIPLDHEPPTPSSGSATLAAAVVDHEPTGSVSAQLTVTSFIGIVAAVLTVIALTADILKISTTAGAEFADVASAVGLKTGVWHVDNLGSNLIAVGLLGAIGLAAGSVGSILNRPWGPGLVGGSGLSVLGTAALTIGLVEFPVGAAQNFAASATGEFTIEITRDLGYWALFAAGGVGLIAFFASMNDLLIDRRASLNPYVHALGALIVVIAAIAPLVPVVGSSWSANWLLNSNEGWPNELMIARLVQLGALAVGGLIGFLTVRPTGLALAFGAVFPSAIATMSAWLGLGMLSLAPGYRNPGGTAGSPTNLLVGASVGCVLVLAVAIAMAYDSHQRS